VFLLKRKIGVSPEVFALAWPVALALALRLALWNACAGVTMDSPLYVRMAESLAAGERGPSPAHHGYPALIALASPLLPGREVPGRVISLLASLAAVALTARLARRHLGPGWASVAACAVALHPLLAIYGVAIMTEASFLAVLLGGLLLVESERPLAGGLVLGAAYAIRPEAIVIAPLAALLARGPWRARARVLAGSAAVILGYVVFLHGQQGWWSLTPKTALVTAAGGGRSAEWHLADSTAVADTVGLIARARAAGPRLVAEYLPRWLRHGHRLVQAWPVPLLALSLAPLLRRGTSGREAWRPLLAPLACLFVYPLLAAPDDVRFAQLFVPSLAVLAAGGAAAGWARGPAGRAVVLLLAAAGVALLALGPLPRLALHFDDGPMRVLREAGAWLRERGPADAVVMDRKAYVPFFAGMRHAQIPDDDLDAILDHAQRSGARYLVVEEYVTASLRPQLEPLLDPARLAGEHRLHMAHVLRPAPGEGVAIFEIDRRLP
jgi:hypothetical protein